MTEQYLISIPSHNDVEKLSTLLGTLFEMEEEFFANKENQVKGLENIIKHPEMGTIFIVKLNNQIVGMVNLLYTFSTALGGKVAILEDLIIDKEHRNKGLGTKLIKHAISHCQNNDYKRITLLTDITNKNAQKFYSKMGFEASSMVVMRNIF